MKNYMLIGGLLLSITSIYTQNLPSLLTGKNINATFSIIAFDSLHQEWGIAVATNNLYVGNSTVYIEPGVGAFSVIAETNPVYGVIGLEHLSAGKSITEAIEEVRLNDGAAHYRQVAGIDADGKTSAFTGSALKYWKGTAKHIVGKNYVVLGNQLEEGVLENMANAYEQGKGTLAQRLLKALLSGQNVGGQISGKQSAAVVVKGANNAWFNQIDLRVDHSQSPLKDLQKLMDYHYGRIRLNQALYASRAGNKNLGIQRLSEAENMLAGWSGMYAKIAMANVILGQEETAVKWIEKGLTEQPKWAVNLPAFYFLRNHPRLKNLINPEEFNAKDWESAMMMLSQLGNEKEVIVIGHMLLEQKIDTPYSNFLLGRSYYFEKESDIAEKYLERSLGIDKDNVEALNLMNKISKMK